MNNDVRNSLIIALAAFALVWIAGWVYPNLPVIGGITFGQSLVWALILGGLHYFRESIKGFFKGVFTKVGGLQAPDESTGHSLGSTIGSFISKITLMPVVVLLFLLIVNTLGYFGDWFTEFHLKDFLVLVVLAILLVWTPTNSRVLRGFAIIVMIMAVVSKIAVFAINWIDGNQYFTGNIPAYSTALTVNKGVVIQNGDKIFLKSVGDIVFEEQANPSAVGGKTFKTTFVVKQNLAQLGLQLVDGSGTRSFVGSASPSWDVQITVRDSSKAVITTTTAVPARIEVHGKIVRSERVATYFSAHASDFLGSIAFWLILWGAFVLSCHLIRFWIYRQFDVSEEKQPIVTAFTNLFWIIVTVNFTWYLAEPFLFRLYAWQLAAIQILALVIAPSIAIWFVSSFILQGKARKRTALVLWLLVIIIAVGQGMGISTLNDLPGWPEIKSKGIVLKEKFVDGKPVPDGFKLFEFDVTDDMGMDIPLATTAQRKTVITPPVTSSLDSTWAVVLAPSTGDTTWSINNSSQGGVLEPGKTYRFEILSGAVEYARTNNSQTWDSLTSGQEIDAQNTKLFVYATQAAQTATLRVWQK